MSDIAKMLGDVTLRCAPAPGAIDVAERVLGLQFPQDYRTFMSAHDGAFGMISLDGDIIQLWELEHVADQYGYEISPELMLFGSSGGGVLYGFDRRDTRMAIVSIDAIGDTDTIEAVADTFTQFVQVIAARKYRD